MCISTLGTMSRLSSGTRPASSARSLAITRYRIMFYTYCILPEEFRVPSPILRFVRLQVVGLSLHDIYSNVGVDENLSKRPDFPSMEGLYCLTWLSYAGVCSSDPLTSCCIRLPCCLIVDYACNRPGNSQHVHTGADRQQAALRCSASCSVSRSWRRQDRWLVRYCSGSTVCRILPYRCGSSRCVYSVAVRLGSNHPAGLAGVARTTPVPCSSNWTERRSCALAVCRGRRILEAIV